MALPMSWRNAARTATWASRPSSLRHDAGQPGHLGRVREHVLAVARAELQPAHQAEDLGMQVVEAQLERDGLAFLADGLLRLVLHLLDDLLDARRMDAPVGDEALDGLLGDFAAVGVETREDDGAGRVVHDQIDAGRQFERADVAAFAADDAALQVVARQVDDRHGGFDGVLGSATAGWPP